MILFRNKHAGTENGLGLPRFTPEEGYSLIKQGQMPRARCAWGKGQPEVLLRLSRASAESVIQSRDKFSL